MRYQPASHAIVLLHLFTQQSHCPNVLIFNSSWDACPAHHVCPFSALANSHSYVLRENLLWLYISSCINAQPCNHKLLVCFVGPCPAPVQLPASGCSWKVPSAHSSLASGHKVQVSLQCKASTWWIVRKDDANSMVTHTYK